MIDLWLTDQSGSRDVSKITGRYGLGLLQRQNESNHGRSFYVQILKLALMNSYADVWRSFEEETKKHKRQNFFAID